MNSDVQKTKEEVIIMDDKPFFHSEKKAKDGSVWGVKGFQDGFRLTHQVESQEFHLTMPINIEGIGKPIKTGDYYDTGGTFKGFEIGG